MKWMVTVALAALLAAGCCTKVGGEVRELRALHKAYRSGTEAKKTGVDGKPIDPKDVDLLGQKIDEALAKLEDLTR